MRAPPRTAEMARPQRLTAIGDSGPVPRRPSRSGVAALENGDTILYAPREIVSVGFSSEVEW